MVRKWQEAQDILVIHAFTWYSCEGFVSRLLKKSESLLVSLLPHIASLTSKIHMKNTCVFSIYAYVCLSHISNLQGFVHIGNLLWKLIVLQISWELKLAKSPLQTPPHIYWVIKNNLLIFGLLTFHFCNPGTHLPGLRTKDKLSSKTLSKVTVHTTWGMNRDSYRGFESNLLLL